MILKSDFKSSQELVEVVLPGMADKDGSCTYFFRGGKSRCSGMCLSSEQLAVREADPSTTIARVGLRKAFNHREHVCGGTVRRHLVLHVLFIEEADGSHGNAVGTKHRLTSRLRTSKR